MGGKCQRRISPKWYTSPIKHSTNKKTAATLSNSRLPSKMICIAFAECQLFKLWLFTNSPIVSDGYFIHSLTVYCTFLHIFCTFRHFFSNLLHVLIVHNMQILQKSTSYFFFYTLFLFVFDEFRYGFFRFQCTFNQRVQDSSSCGRTKNLTLWREVFCFFCGFVPL